MRVASQHRSSVINALKLVHVKYKAAVHCGPTIFLGVRRYGKQYETVSLADQFQKFVTI